ncbi:protein HEG [Anguilla anguilla]|uniref:protein HEG n=1 Tax=Anguilla anguilla TaxID=7936 RepID=UPI0015B1EE7D|nr:protein HEG [Anguilla anguilla]
METCSVIQKSRLVLLALLLIVFNALCAARSFTASTDTDHTAMTESYLPFNVTNLEEITALPTEFVNTASSSTRGAVTEWENSASTEIRDPLLGFSEEQQPPTEANSATEVNASTRTSVDTESWDSPALTDGAYTSSTISRAGERTLLSVTTNSTAPYTDNSSPYSETSPYSKNTSSYSKNTSPYSDNSSPYSDLSSPYSDNSSHSENTSSYSENTSPFSENSTPYSEEFNSSQAYSQGFTQEGRSESTVNGVSTDGATSPGFDQSDAPSGSFSSHFPTNSSRSAHSETGLPSDISEPSTGTEPDSTPNSTPPLTITDRGGGDGADTTHFGHTSRAGTYQSETGYPSSSEPSVPSTEDNAPNTSRPGKESAITSVSAAGTTTESSTGAFRPPAQDHTQDHTQDTQPHTQEDDPDQAFSTVAPEGDDTTTVIYSPSTVFPFTPETERPAMTTEVLATTLMTSTERTQFAEGDTFQTATSASVTMPGSTTTPYRPGTSAEPSTPPTTTATATTTTTTTTAATTAFPWTTLEPQASPSTAQYLPPSHTAGTVSHTSAATSPISTDVSTLHLETSTATPGNATRRAGHTTASYSNTARSRTVPAHTTGNHTDRASTTFQATTVQMHVRPTVMPESPCGSNPCRNGGTCMLEGGKGHRCVCLPSWTGPDCSEDMDECVSAPCPVGSKCVNTRGSFGCVCPLGSDLEHGRACTRARTFLGTFHLSNVPFNSTHPRSFGLHELQREIIQLLNASLSVLKGYSRSTLNKSEGDGVQISAVHTFAMSADVTSELVTKKIEAFLESCSQAVGHCKVALHHSLLYKAESLCIAMGTQCDPERTNCTDADGTTSCQCHAGYFKHNIEDLTCRECEDGFKLENGTCVRCMFGFGGFNCGNFYKLITVVVSPAGGVLLLILIIALIVTCCRKDKNDISKIIFKSGDFQLSPYAEYPKNNRVSMEWGRETIEMQENGSTKNLLQMTDIYYSPALRNPELERSGLYPFSGMPGSRHSCIYPAQWNPSFISDDTRRRDYF